MSGWEQGREEMLGMIERRELDQVTASTDLADRMLLREAQQGLNPWLAIAPG